MSALLPLSGIFIIIFFSWLISKDKKFINWKIILLSFLLLFSLGIIFTLINNFFTTNNLTSNSTSKFISSSNSLSAGELIFGELYEKNGFILKIFVNVIFICALLSILSFFKFFKFLIKISEITFAKLFFIGPIEALICVNHTFLGQLESVLPLKDYLQKLSGSGFFTILVVGMSTMSANAIGAYSGLGIKTTSLIIANLMAIPASIIISKLIYPEKNKENNDREHIKSININSEKMNFFEALYNGTCAGIKLSLLIIAAVVGSGILLDLLRIFFEHFLKVNLIKIFGSLFYPILFFTGVKTSDILNLGSILGIRLLMNDLLAYIELTRSIHVRDYHSYSLGIFLACGFGNLAKSAVVPLFAGEVMPEKKNEFMSVIPLALLASALSSCLSTFVISLLLFLT